jgi:hypothetical protein
MVMVVVKVDGEGDGGDGSGCDVEGVAWRIANSKHDYFKGAGHSMEGNEFGDIHFTALGI